MESAVIGQRQVVPGIFTTFSKPYNTLEHLAAPLRAKE
jgi:hypothetical protein